MPGPYSFEVYNWLRTQAADGWFTPANNRYALGPKTNFVLEVSEAQRNIFAIAACIYCKSRRGCIASEDYGPLQTDLLKEWFEECRWHAMAHEPREFTRPYEADAWAMLQVAAKTDESLANELAPALSFLWAWQWSPEVARALLEPASREQLLGGSRAQEASRPWPDSPERSAHRGS